MRKVLLDAFLLIKGIEIARNPAEDPVCQQPLLLAVMWKKGRAIEVIERQDFHLSRDPAVKRALVPHDIIDHETDAGATEHQHDVLLLPCVIDRVLQDALDRRVLRCQEGKLIDDQDGLPRARCRLLAKIGKRPLPIGKRR